MADPQRGDDPWNVFAEQYDAFLGRPRRDHGLAVDAAGLGRAILAQPDLSAGALGLRGRLVDQVGPREASDAWVAAWEWIREHYRSMASARLDRALEGLIAALREGGEGGEAFLAEAGALLEDVAGTDPGLAEG